MQIVLAARRCVRGCFRVLFAPSYRPLALAELGLGRVIIFGAAVEALTRHETYHHWPSILGMLAGLLRGNSHMLTRTRSNLFAHRQRHCVHELAAQPQNAALPCLITEHVTKLRV